MTHTMEQTISVANRLPCTTCRRRKVRCSKTRPCTNCVKAGIDCHYERESRSPLSSLTGDTSPVVNVELVSRVARLQDSIKRLSMHPETGAQVPLDQSGGNNKLDEGGRLSGNFEGQQALANLITMMEDCVQELQNVNERENSPSPTGKLCFRDGHTRYVRETFWAGLYEEVESLKFLLENDHPDSPSQGTTGLLFHPQQSPDVSMYRPPRAASDFLIDHFLSNVDPFVRLFHKPRFKLELDLFYRHEESFESQRGDFDALLFSVYAFSAHSLHEEDILVYFGESKESLVARFTTATQKALEQTNILSTQSLTALTAFALYITLLSETDSSNLQWTSLSALSLSLATRMGLHRDGTQFNLSPYAVEIRRRLWHYLCMINVRALGIHGIEPFPISVFGNGATQLPQNSPDSGWDACEFSRKLSPVVSGWTEMVPAIVSFEMSTLTRTILETKIPDHGSEDAYLTSNDQLMLNAKSRIDKFYTHDLSNEPIQRATQYLVTLNFQWLWFFTRQSLLKHRTWSTPELCTELFRKALAISETTQHLQKAYAERHWDWLFRGFHEVTKWHLASTMLVYLRHHTEPEDMEVQRAWTQIDIIFNHAKHDQGALWKPLLAMKREAEIRRDEAVTAKNGNMRATNYDGSWQAQLDHGSLMTMSEVEPIFAHWGDSGAFFNTNSGMSDDFYNSILGGYNQGS